MREHGIPFVAHGRTSAQAHHAWFDIDNVGAFRHVVRHLAALGIEVRDTADGHEWVLADPD